MAINFNKAEFVLSAVKASTFIRDGKPQVTFAGRSNVGKSSVINRLLGRKNFARVGATPGKTNQINYFDIDGKIYFTDLPGYGYAKVSKEERDRWGRLMESYFAEPDLITLGVLIVDARHKPTADDVTMCDWFKGTGCPVIVVANKLDKLKKSQVEPALELIRETLELTERTAVEAPKLMLWHMQEFGKIGMGFAMDDYGNGNSNCSYLIHFPFREIKIDKNMTWS